MPETRLKSELEVLSALESGKAVSQAAVSRRIGVAVGLVNALIKRATRKGFVKVQAVPYKRFAYYLTPKGFAEKSRLVAEYIEVSLEFFREARLQYADLFSRLENVGIRRVVLYGAGDLTEIAVLASNDSRIEVVAVVDARTNKSRIQGLPVAKTLDDVTDFDAVILADNKSAQDSYDALRRRLPPDRLFAPALLKVMQSQDEERQQPAEASA